MGAKYAIASVWSADRDFSRVQFEKMCDLADKYGMKLNLEFVPFSNIPGLTEALAWMDLMDRGGRLYVGEGGIDLAGMLKNIPDPPYYSIELPNAAEVAIRGKLEHARRCLETAKTFFAAHQI